MICIDLENVNFSYIHQSIFKDITVKLSSGEKIQLIGDNGAGKTTFLKMISGLLKPQSGDIFFSQANYDLDMRSLRKISGVSLDDTHLLRNFSVTENLMLYLRMYGVEPSFNKISPWLDRFHLQTYRETQIHHLSQGEQRKVSIIKALLHEPQVIILDEPTNSLDQESKKNLSDILNSLSTDHLVLVSTHDHEWAKTWSNRSIEVKEGRLL